MQHLSKIIITIFATILALTIVLLYLFFINLDLFRPQISSLFNRAWNIDVKLQKLNTSWQCFGPTLDISGIDISFGYSKLYMQNAKLELDIWQSLLQWSWKFHDIIFYRLQCDLNTILMFNDHISHENLTRFNNNYNYISNILLYQFDNFIIRDSQIIFLTPNGEKGKLFLPKFTWINISNRHRAEGKVILSISDIKHNNTIDLRIDIYDQHKLAGNSNIYIQVNNVDLKPWLNQLLKGNANFQNVNFNLSTLLTIKNSKIFKASTLLSKGTILWKDNVKKHQLNFDQLMINFSRYYKYWHMNIPVLNISTDGQSWAPAKLSLFWLPIKKHIIFPNIHSKIYLNAQGLYLEKLSLLLPFIPNISPMLLDRLYSLTLRGELSKIVLDIPINDLNSTRFQISWNNISCKNLDLLFDLENISGSIEGTIATGKLQLEFDNGVFKYPSVFHTPFTLFHGRATFNWNYSLQDGLSLWGHNIDMKDKSLWANGSFYFYKPTTGDPWLDIFANMSLNNIDCIKSYIPESLVKISIVEYLIGALKGGQVENATVLFSGNPQKFPFKYNDGKFEIRVSLKKAEYKFKPGWPSLKQLNVNLNFINESLFIYIPQILFGEVIGSNISASISSLSTERLLIDILISGNSHAIRNYFFQTPLKASFVKIFDELQVSGEIQGNLHLDIPLNNKPITITGNIVLQNNSLFIKSLDTTLKRINGNFYYNNGNLDSIMLDAYWFDQPVAISCTTRKKSNGIDIKINLKGNWMLNHLSMISTNLKKYIYGSAVWQSNISVFFPFRGNTNYQIVLKGDLKNVSCYLPQPLNKIKGKPFMFKIKASGDMHSLFLSGYVGMYTSFNSQWLLGKHITLARGILTNEKKIPFLPVDNVLIISLPTFDIEKWLVLHNSVITRNISSSLNSYLRYPNRLNLYIQNLVLGGQTWHQLNIIHSNISNNSSEFIIQGKEINGKFIMTATEQWNIDLTYLYYNPKFVSSLREEKSFPKEQFLTNNYLFSVRPTISVTCRQCWIKGQNLGQVSATIKPQQNKFILINGIVNTGTIRLIVEGSWLYNYIKNKTIIKGIIVGKDISIVTNYTGIFLPLKESTFVIKYNLFWNEKPWKLNISNLNGLLYSKLGKGRVDNINSSNIGRLLRLVSLNALLRKLHFDFSDIFGNGFYFDSIKGTIWLKNGTLYTNNLIIDGLEADIIIKGNIDFNRQDIDMEALITPEISTMAGVATAFVTNPTIGVTVFAVSKILSPLLSKYLTKYHISGSLKTPQIKKITRQP